MREWAAPHDQNISKPTWNFQTRIKNEWLLLEDKIDIVIINNQEKT